MIVTYDLENLTTSTFRVIHQNPTLNIILLLKYYGRKRMNKQIYFSIAKQLRPTSIVGYVERCGYSSLDVLLEIYHLDRHLYARNDSII